MFELFVYDSIVFLSSVIIALVFLVKRTRHNKYLLTLGIIYILGTFSSYNIMVKPIMDYLIIVPRNAFYHLKLIGPASLSDVLMIIGIIFIMLYSFLYKKRINYLFPKVFTPIFLRDLLIIIFSMIMFLMLKDVTGSKIQNEIIWYRQFIYYCFLFMLINEYMKSKSPYDFANIFMTFLVLDVMNFISGFISTTFIYKDIVWQRYFANVTIIDQDDYIIALMYLLLLIYYLVSGDKTKKTRLYKFSIVTISILIICNFVKGIFLFAALFIPFMAFAAFKLKQKGAYRRIFALFAVIPFAALSFYLFAVVGSKHSQSLSTRSDAMNDYFSSVSKLGDTYFLTGIGNGTYYFRNDSDDLGETKAIERENTPNQAFIMQTIFIQFYKAGGIVAILVYLVFTTIGVKVFLNKYLIDHPFAIVACYQICLAMTLNFFFFSPEASNTFNIAREYLLLSILVTQSKTTGHTHILL